MWSGPRNISTAMMRSFGNRPDTVVCDEPLYAHYLRETGLEHPGRDEVISHHDADWRRVVASLIGPLPAGKSVFYQKHMAHHLLPHIERGWLDEVTNCFLLRDPAAMLLSLVKNVPRPTLGDTGLAQQVEIFHSVRTRTGKTPAVLDARDVLERPRPMLSRLCQALDLPFSEQMLSWPAGRRETDGIWAKHWYAAVERSTSFGPYEPRREELPASLRDLHAQCLEHYRELYAHRLRA
jgi:hypothetical protein